MGHNEGYIQTDDGLRLYYRQAGTGADVVLVPGACWCAADLAVLAHQRTLLFYDQRGRGHQTPMPVGLHGGPSTSRAIWTLYGDISAWSGWR
jgi:hypothetical protein